jgi:hypothetical protein
MRQIWTGTALPMTSLTATLRPSERSRSSCGGRHAGRDVADICHMIGSISAPGEAAGTGKIVAV